MRNMRMAVVAAGMGVCVVAQWQLWYAHDSTRLARRPPPAPRASGG